MWRTAISIAASGLNSRLGHRFDSPDHRKSLIVAVILLVPLML